MEEWLSLYNSHSGERGIFNREAAKKTVAKYGHRDPNFEFGTNPCSEIILRPYQFCNLTEAVVRHDDTLETLLRKVRLATILGTIQSTFTKFPYLRKVWQRLKRNGFWVSPSLESMIIPFSQNKETN